MIGRLAGETREFDRPLLHEALSPPSDMPALRYRNKPSMSLGWAGSLPNGAALDPTAGGTHPSKSTRITQERPHRQNFLGVDPLKFCLI